MELRESVFELEAYWGTRSGALMHGTITVRAPSVEDAITRAIADHIKPCEREDHYPACARSEYYDEHYDVEVLS